MLDVLSDGCIGCNAEASARTSGRVREDAAASATARRVGRLGTAGVGAGSVVAASGACGVRGDAGRVAGPAAEPVACGDDGVVAGAAGAPVRRVLRRLSVDVDSDRHGGLDEQ